jgi:hypothetical protein
MGASFDRAGGGFYPFPCHEEGHRSLAALGMTRKNAVIPRSEATKNLGPRSLAALGMTSEGEGLAPEGKGSG